MAALLLAFVPLSLVYGDDSAAAAQEGRHAAHDARRRPTPADTVKKR